MEADEVCTTYLADHSGGSLLILAHGAGAGQAHPFMVATACGLAARGIDVVTFDFLYIQERRKVPDKTSLLEATFLRVIETARQHELFKGHRLFIGGKSMGGRIASMVADRAAGTMTTYLDGVQTARSTGLTSAFTLTSGFPFTVRAEGSGTDQGDGFVNAFVDDFDFYDSVVSADQIQNDFRATRPATGPATPGSTVPAGFVSDTFRAPEVRAGTTFTQRVAGLFNGGAATFSKVAGDGWLSVDAGGVVTGTAPAAAAHGAASGAGHLDAGQPDRVEQSAGCLRLPVVAGEVAGVVIGHGPVRQAPRIQAPVPDQF